MSPRNKNTEPATDESVLPPGQRDRSGFWLPLGYTEARTLVSRRLRRGRPASSGDDGEDEASPS